ncbi:hypothetical protein KSS87_004759 [Heliosperma pusillum]|nr:hypothetical protein KSS87_009255 [Heliosperma pusillum]KAH9609140.1 hypothetical protein KSS87_004759 [Heliosperma pusillum]
MVENPSKTSKRHANLQNTEQNMSKKQKITEENINNNKYNDGRRIVKLYCPLVSKIAEIMVWDDQRLDIGAIAAVFGLEPGTLKLNGYFVSRGVDFIASSVTWVLLFSFFSKKGLSTGVDCSAALVVDGKVVKSGSKRTHEPPEVDSGLHCTKQCAKEVGICRYSHQDSSLPKHKRLKDSDNALEKSSETARHCDIGLKRRHSVEDKSPLKKVRVGGSYSTENSPGQGENDRSCISKLRCGYLMTETMKRLRVDEVIMAAPCKKTR